MLNIILFLVIYLFNIIFICCKKINLSIPSHLFLVFWIFNIFVAFVVFHNLVSWNFIGLSFLLIYIDVFYFIFSCIINQKNKKIYYTSKKWHEKYILIRFITIVCFISGMLYVFFELYNNGFDFNTFLSLSKLMESGYYFTDGRYGGSTQIVVSTIEQIFLTINYSGFILSGFCFRLNILDKKYCFIQFIPMIMSMLATTAKSTFISGIILWISGYLVAMNCKQSIPELKKTKIKLYLIAMIIMFSLCLFYLSFVIRYGIDNMDLIINRMLVYAIGHVPCYDDWFCKFPINLFGYSYGQQTFMMFFGKNMPKALAQVYFSPKFVTSYSWTNVITLFAYILMDYGFIGSFIFFIIFAFIMSFAYLKLRNYGEVISHGILGLGYYIILYSFLVSPIRYLSIVGAFAVFTFYVFLVKRGLGK